MRCTGTVFCNLTDLLADVLVHVSFDYVMVQGSVFNLRNGNVILEQNVSRVSGTTRTTAYCMNTSKMAFVPKEDSKCTHSSLE